MTQNLSPPVIFKSLTQQDIPLIISPSQKKGKNQYAEVCFNGNHPSEEISNSWMVA